MSNGAIFDLVSSERSDVDTHAYEFRKILNTDNIGIYSDHTVAIAVYCPEVRKYKEQLLKEFDIYNLCEENDLNNLIVDFIIGLQVVLFYNDFYNMENIEGDWYCIKFDDKIIQQSSLYFNYSGTIYCLGIIMNNKYKLEEFMKQRPSPFEEKEWLNNMLNNNIGVDMTLEELTKDTVCMRERMLRGVHIPENTNEIEIKYDDISRYKLAREELYALFLLTGRKNYIPFGNALNLNKVYTSGIKITYTLTKLSLA